MQLYASHDRQPRGVFPVTADRAKVLNADGWGIFWNLNQFKGGLRRLANLRSIYAWFCELDSGTKPEQWARIQACRAEPTLIVESSRGYHCYWKAADATLDNWKRIVRWGIIPALEADKRCCDPTRVLRAPGYLHLKAVPFLVREAHRSSAVYTEAQMMEVFPEVARPEPQAPREKTAESFWSKVAELDGREAVARLSGHWLVKGEVFELVEQPCGNANIWVVDGSARIPTPCFVWANGRMGGVDGGQSVAAFCAWYGHSYADVARGLKELFPELED